MAIDERAKSTVELDGQQAKDELAELRERAKAFRKELRDVTEKNDLQGVRDLEKKLKDVNAEMATSRKTIFNYNQVLRNLSGSTLKDLERAYGQISKELKNTTRGSDAFIQKNKQLSQVRNELNKTRADVNRFATTQNQLTGFLAKGVGLIGGFYGAIKIGQGIINSASAASDKFEEVLGGINAGLGYVAKSIAMLDFSNFFKNLGEAIRVGRDYIKTLDDISNMNRALKIQEADAQAYILDRMLILRDVTKTEKERIKAADEIIAKEDELADKRVKIAQKAYDGILSKLMSESKLRKEELESYVRNYTELKPVIEKAQELNRAYENIASARKLLNQQTTEQGVEFYQTQISDYEKVITTADVATRDMAETIKGTGKLTEDGGELDQLVQLYIELAAASRSAKENIADVFARRSRLLAKSEDDKTSAESPMHSIEKFQAEDLKRAEKEFDAYAEMVLEILTTTEEGIKDFGKQNMQELQDMNIQRIKSDAEYELEMQQYTFEGRKKLLKKQLAEGSIAEKEYADLLRKIDIEYLTSKAELYAQFFGSLAQLFRQNTLMYKITASAEAAIATYTAAAKALEEYKWPLSLLVISSILATGLAQVAKINGIQFWGGGDTGPGDDREPAGIVHKNEYVITARQMRDPKIRGIVHNVIEPDRVAHVNFSGAQTAVANLRGYAGGGYVTQPAPVNNININNNELADQGRQTNMLLVQLIEMFVAGKINAIFSDRAVEDISSRQSIIGRIKSSVSRNG